MNEEHDDISAWAESLTPEGSPGVMSDVMRGILGDKKYEEEVERRERAADLILSRAQSINNTLVFVSLFVLLYGLLGLAAFGTFVFRFIF